VKRVMMLGALLVVGAFVVDALGDATQTRDDDREHDMQTEVVIHVEGRHYRQSLATAALTLWGSCSATVAGDLVRPGIESVGRGDYRFAMTPSLGEHGKERLLGCLNDISIDRVKSNVESVHDVPLRVAVG
jgi:hypothetical protein